MLKSMPTQHRSSLVVVCLACILILGTWLVPVGLSQETDNGGGEDTGSAATDDGAAPTTEAGDGDLLDQIVPFITERGTAFLLNVIASIALLVIGRWVVRLLTKLLDKLIMRAKVDEPLVKFITNLAYVAMMALVVLAAINRLGIDTTSFAALIAASGLAVGFALQGSLSNFAAGVMIIIFKPFRVGNFVEAGGTSGVVEEIQIFNTIMRTGDNKQSIVPNSNITGENITNFSAKDTRRIDLVIGCGYDDDLRLVRQFLEELLAGEERVLDDPEPIVKVHELADSSVNFIVRPWVESSEYWNVRWDLTEQIKLGFDERGFSIPFPSHDVHVHNAA